MPTSVARSGANLPSGNFVPEVWSKKLNAKYYAASVCMAICNTKWEGEIKGQGSKVIIRIRPDIIIGDYVANGTINYQDLADDKVELLIDKAKYAAFKADDIDTAQADINFVNEATQDAAEQMKIAVDTDMLGTVYTSAGSTVTSQQITALTVLNWCVDGGTKLDELNVPSTGRWLVIPPWIAGFIKKSDLKDASISGDGTSLLRNGRLGIIDRFDIYVSNNLAGAVASAGVPQQCMAGTKDAVAYASQFTKTETLRLQNSFGNAIRSLNVYGYKVVHAPALVSMPAFK